MTEINSKRIVQTAPEQRYTLLEDAEGRYATVTGAQTVSYTDTVSDHSLWLPGDTSETWRSLARPDLQLRVNAARLTPRRGPHATMTSLSEQLRASGWVCLPAILSCEVVRRLRERAQARPGEVDHHIVATSLAAARASAEPVSLALVQSYLGNVAMRFAHPPALVDLPPDDGIRAVQGWHCDYPYLWGSPSPVQEQVPVAASGLVLGVQRTICISGFRRANGATVFRLDWRNQPPPGRVWGWWSAYAREGARARRGMPHAGPDTQVIEAPAGSILIYDARIWHRQGVNLTDTSRPAILQSVTPRFIAPFIPTHRAARAMADAQPLAALTKREHMALSALMT